MLNSNSLNGRVGQVKGPFDSSDLLAPGGAIFELTPESTPPVLEKLGIQTDVGTNVQINNMVITVGKTGIYELDYTVAIKRLLFPDGAGSDTLVDFIY